MTSPSLVARRRLVSACVGGGLAVAGILASLALVRRSDAPPPRAADGSVVLETRVDLARGPVDRRLLAPGPCEFEVDVAAPVAVRVTFGPPAPSTPDAEGGPAPETATIVPRHPNGSVTGAVLVYAAGIQVLRVEATEPNARGEAVIRVRRRPRS